MSTAPQKSVLVLMPFDNSFKDVYEVGIKAACKEAGVYCDRLDEQIFSESILSRIYNQISKADIVVADMTGRNPNVFYEVGYAHALDKLVILLTQTDDDIPFDLKHYKHIVYGESISTLKTELEKNLVYHVQHPENINGRRIDVIRLSLDGNYLSPRNRMVVEKDVYVSRPDPSDDQSHPLYSIFNRRTEGMFSFSITVENDPTQRIETVTGHIGIIVPDEISLRVDGVSHKVVKENKLSDGTRLYVMAQIKELFPGMLEEYKYTATFSGEITEITDGNNHVELTARIFRKTGPVDYSCYLKLEEEGSS